MTLSEKALIKIRIARGRKPKKFKHNKQLSFVEALSLAVKNDKYFATNFVAMLAPTTFPLTYLTKDL